MENLLLSRLSKEDAGRLGRHFKTTSFKQHSVLFDAEASIERVYFPVGAVVSLVAALESGAMVEAAMIGADGVVGASAALGGRVSPCRAIVQVSGDIIVCTTDGLKSAASQSPALLSLLVRHEQSVYAQAQQSAACFALHHVHARLCRWLMRVRDLSGTDTFSFTQEYLAGLLGVRRTSLTLVAHALQAAGLINYVRGKIEILNAEGLRDGVCECYETVKRQHASLLGSANARGMGPSLHADPLKPAATPPTI